MTTTVITLNPSIASCKTKSTKWHRTKMLHGEDARLHNLTQLQLKQHLDTILTLYSPIFLSFPALPFPQLPVSISTSPLHCFPPVIHCLVLDFLTLSPLLFYSFFLSLLTAEERRQMTRESRLTDSCCQNTSIKHTYSSVGMTERTHTDIHRCS